MGSPTTNSSHAPGLLEIKGNDAKAKNKKILLSLYQRVCEELKNAGIDPDELKDQNKSDESEVEVEQKGDLQKPYPNEHAARMVDPGKFKEIRRQNNKFGPGIHVIFGITEAGKAEVQSIRFSSSKFSADEAHAWLSAHNYHPIEFAAATGVEKIDSPIETPSTIEKSWNVDITKADSEKQIVYGVAYPLFPLGEKDTQNDRASAEEIEKMAWGFMENSRAYDLQHKKVIDSNKARIVESYIAPVDFDMNGCLVAKGSWVVATHIVDKDIWQQVKSGMIKSYSIRGMGTRSRVR
jgi:hypothetical protein